MHYHLPFLEIENGVSKTYIVALSFVFGILSIVMVLTIAFIVCFKKLRSSEEKISLKNVDVKGYETLD